MSIVEALEAAPVGSVVVHSDGGESAWFKNVEGQWISPYGDLHDPSDFGGPFWGEYILAFQPIEEAN